MQIWYFKELNLKGNNHNNHLLCCNIRNCFYLHVYPQMFWFLSVFCFQNYFQILGPHFVLQLLVQTAMSCDSVTAYIKFSYSVTRVADDNCSVENSTNWVFCESFFFKVYITCYWVYRILLTVVFNAVCDGELIWKSDSYFNYYSCVRSGFSWWSHKQFCPLNAPAG